MVDFRPFRGLVPKLSKKESIAERVSPPYDVISQEELIKLQSHPFNITRITLGGKDGSYEEAAKELSSWISSKKLVEEEDEAFYLYRQSYQKDGQWLARNGIVGILRTEGYEKGGIIPHEETFPKVKEDRLNLLRWTSIHPESIFALFDKWDISLEEVERKAAKLFEFRDKSGTIHVFSRISDKTSTEAIQRMMAGKKVLIADGHHRYETAYRYSTEHPGDQKRAYVLCTMVSSQDSGMFVLPTHRLLKNVKIPESEFLERLAKHFAIKEAKNLTDLSSIMDSAARPVFGIWLDSGKMIAAEFTGPRGDILWEVDTYVCQEVLLKEVVYSFPQANEIQIDYDHSLDSIEKRMKSKEVNMTILVRPPSLELVWKVAASGRKMPKKTTFFWPKIWSGFVLYQMK